MTELAHAMVATLTRAQKIAWQKLKSLFTVS